MRRRRCKDHRSADRRTAHASRRRVQTATALVLIRQSRTVGLELVGSDFATRHNAPEDVWRFFTDDAKYSHSDVDGGRNVGYGSDTDSRVVGERGGTGDRKRRVRRRRLPIAGRPVGGDGPVPVRSIVGYGDDGEVRPVFCGQVYRARVVRRVRFRRDRETHCRRASDAADTSTATGGATRRRCTIHTCLSGCLTAIATKEHQTFGR